MARIPTPVDFILGSPKKLDVLVSADEGGDIGSRFEGDWYILCATVVDDAQRFSDAVGRLHFAKKAKFRRCTKRREQVLEYAVPAVKRVYYVVVRKKENEFRTEDQRLIHATALGLLADSVLHMERAEKIHADIDNTSMIDDDDAKEIFELNPYYDNRFVTADVVRSKDSLSMQTHDFFVGTIGRKFNHDDYRYTDLMNCSVMGQCFDSNQIIEMGRKAGMNRSCEAVRVDISGDCSIGSDEYLKNPDHDNRSALDLTAPGAIMRQSMEGFDMECNGRCV